MAVPQGQGENTFLGSDKLCNDGLRGSSRKRTSQHGRDLTAGAFPQPVKRRRGGPRSRRLISDLAAPLHTPPPVGSTVDTSLQAPTTIKAPLQPLGLNIDSPLEILSDEEEEQRDAKFKVNPLLKLRTPERRHYINEGTQQIHEEFVCRVKSMLVEQLTCGTMTEVEAMVSHANGAFTILAFLGDDYKSFYEDVKELISHLHDVQVAVKQGELLSFHETKKRYEEVVVSANDLEKEITLTQGKVKTSKNQKECLKTQIEDAKEMIRRLELEMASIEQDFEHLERNEQKLKEAHRFVQDEVQKVETKIEADEIAQKEIEERKNATYEKIQSITQRLQPQH